MWRVCWRFLDSRIITSGSSISFEDATAWVDQLNVSTPEIFHWVDYVMD